MRITLPVPFLAFPLALPRAPGEADVRALLPDAQGTKPLAARLVEADRATIARAVGRDPAAPAPAAELYSTRATVEDEPTDLQVAIVPAKGPKGDFRVALAVDSSAEVRIAKVLGDAGAAGAEEFLSQFVGPFAAALPGPTTARPLSALEEKRAASKGEGPEARKLRTMFALRALMQENQSASDAIEAAIGRKEWAAGVSHAQRLAGNLGRLAAFEPDLPPLLEGKDAAAFLQFAEATKKVTGDLAQALEKGDGTKASGLSTSLQQSCARCHGWDAHRYKKPLTNAFEKLREEAGIGTGYFVVGHDVLAAPGEEASSQAVAFAIKEGLLLLQKAP